MSEAIQARYFREPETGRPMRVQVFRDDDMPNPREDYDHHAVLLTFDGQYRSPDSEAPDVLDAAVARWSGGRGGWIEAAYVLRYAAMFAADDVVFAGALRYGQDGTLTLYNGAAVRAWEHYSGIAVVTRQAWHDAMGPDYAGEITPQLLVQQELDEYNAWVTGEVYGYEVTAADVNSEVIAGGEPGDSCWGIFGEPEYAMSEGVMTVMGERSVGGGRPWQPGFELDEDEFEQAVSQWCIQYGRRPVGTGWPS